MVIAIIVLHEGSPGLRPGRFLVSQLIAEMAVWIIQLNSRGLHEPSCNSIAQTANKIEGLNVAATFATTCCAQLGIVNIIHVSPKNERLGSGVIAAPHCCLLTRN